MKTTTKNEYLLKAVFSLILTLLYSWLSGQDPLSIDATKLSSFDNLTEDSLLQISVIECTYIEEPSKINYFQLTLKVQNGHKDKSVLLQIDDWEYFKVGSKKKEYFWGITRPNAFIFINKLYFSKKPRDITQYQGKDMLDHAKISTALSHQSFKLLNPMQSFLVKIRLPSCFLSLYTHRHLQLISTYYYIQEKHPQFWEEKEYLYNLDYIEIPFCDGIDIKEGNRQRQGLLGRYTAPTKYTTGGIDLSPTPHIFKRVKSHIIYLPYPKPKK
jgi:hypothetical protein